MIAINTPLLTFGRNDIEHVVHAPDKLQNDSRSAIRPHQQITDHDVFHELDASVKHQDSLTFGVTSGRKHNHRGPNRVVPMTKHGLDRFLLIIAKLILFHRPCSCVRFGVWQLRRFRHKSRIGFDSMS